MWPSLKVISQPTELNYMDHFYRSYLHWFVKRLYFYYTFRTRTNPVFMTKKKNYKNIFPRRTSYRKSPPCARVNRSIVTYLPLYFPSGDSKDKHRWWTYLFIDLRAVATCTCPAEHTMCQCAACSIGFVFNTCHIAARLLQVASFCVVHMRQCTFGVIFCNLSCSHVVTF